MANLQEPVPGIAAMGGDGGQVIDRATMVRTKGWGLTKGAVSGSYSNSLGEMANYLQPVSEDRGMGNLERRRTRMSTCMLSQQALQEPVVACRLGNLYNKEAIIGALLSRTIPQEFGHIRALKDVKQCLLTWKQCENESGLKRMVCPVSREDLDVGCSRAVLIWSTGAVVSQKALKEMKLKECPVTGKPFDQEADVMPLAPEGEELAKLRERLPQPKKRKAAEVEEVAPVGLGQASAASKEVKQEVKTEEKESKEAKATKSEAKSSQAEVFKSLFTKDRGVGLTGTRDAFGTPCYNRGSRCM